MKAQLTIPNTYTFEERLEQVQAKFKSSIKRNNSSLICNGIPKDKQKEFLANPSALFDLVDNK